MRAFFAGVKDAWLATSPWVWALVHALCLLVLWANGRLTLGLAVFLSAFAGFHLGCGMWIPLVDRWRVQAEESLEGHRRSVEAHLRTIEIAERFASSVGSKAKMLQGVLTHSDKERPS